MVVAVLFRVKGHRGDPASPVERRAAQANG